MSSVSGPAPAGTAAPPPAPAPRRGRKMPIVYVPPGSTRKAQRRLGLIFVTPLIVMIGIFMVFPLINAFYYSLVDFDGLDPTPPWVGLDNFTELLQDDQVYAAFKNNVIWVIIG